jgi:hypothetical protein
MFKTLHKNVLFSVSDALNCPRINVCPVAYTHLCQLNLPVPVNPIGQPHKDNIIGMTTPGLMDNDQRCFSFGTIPDCLLHERCADKGNSVLHFNGESASLNVVTPQDAQAFPAGDFGNGFFRPLSSIPVS